MQYAFYAYIIPIYLKPDVVNLFYFKLRLFDLKMYIGKIYIWEVAAWEIAHLGSCHLGNCHLGSRPWENAFGKVPNTNIYINTLITPRLIYTLLHLN